MDDRFATESALFNSESSPDEEFERLLTPTDVRRSSTVGKRVDGVRVGRLVGFLDVCQTPLVTYSGQPSAAALPARTTIDLHGDHVGREVLLMFEDADSGRPIVIGCFHQTDTPLAADRQVEVDADGRRLVISADDQIVLRCGKASITLTKEGKLIIQGAYVSNQSSGVLRIKGGSVQIN